MKIVILGAYGFTGMLVCEVLTELGVDYAVAGKDEEKLRALGNAHLEVMDVLNENEVKSLVGKYNIFVNCVGPFSEFANVLLQQVVHAGKIYLDITGESVFVQASRNKYHELAKRNQALVLHSCAFESVLADLMAAQLNMKNLITINSYYLLGKAKPSPGTRLTMKLAKYSQPYFYKNSMEIDIKEMEIELVDFEGVTGFAATPYPLPEICFFRWAYDAENIGSYLLVDASEAKYLVRDSPVSRSKSEVLEQFWAKKPKEPKPGQRQNQQFTLIVDATDAHQTKRVFLKGQDMYWLTAKIIGFFIQKINKQPKRVGVLSPNQFLGSNHDFFKSLDLNPIVH